MAGSALKCTCLEEHAMHLLCSGYAALLSSSSVNKAICQVILGGLIKGVFVNGSLYGIAILSDNICIDVPINIINILKVLNKIQDSKQACCNNCILLTVDFVPLLSLELLRQYPQKHA